MSERCDFELQRHAGSANPGKERSEKQEPSGHARMLRITRKPSIKSATTSFRDPQALNYLYLCEDPVDLKVLHAKIGELKPESDSLEARHRGGVRAAAPKMSPAGTYPVDNWIMHAV